MTLHEQVPFKAPAYLLHLALIVRFWCILPSPYWGRGTAGQGGCCWPRHSSQSDRQNLVTRWSSRSSHGPSLSPSLPLMDEHRHTPAAAQHHEGFHFSQNVVMCLQNNFCQPQLLPSENFISPACHFIPTSGLLNHACWGPDKVSHFNIRLSKMLRLSTFQATRTVWSGGQRGVWRVLHQPMFGPAHVPGPLVYHHVIII